MVLLLVLGEGDAEEGERFLRPGTPGDPIHEDDLGALHVLVQRVLRERLGVEAVPVWPPRLRSGRRSGNPGLLFDLAGRARSADAPRAAVPGTSDVRNPLRRWLDLCVGRNGVDLAVVVKDSGIPGTASATRTCIHEAIAPSSCPVDVVVGAATPCLEGWLLLVDESAVIDERQAKALWRAAGCSLRPARGDYLRLAQSLSLDALCRASPDGFGSLVADLAAWAAHARSRGQVR